MVQRRVSFLGTRTQERAEAGSPALLGRMSMDMHTLLHAVVEGDSGPIEPGLCRISYLDFQEHPFHTLG